MGDIVLLGKIEQSNMLISQVLNKCIKQGGDLWQTTARA